MSAHAQMNLTNFMTPPSKTKRSLKAPSSGPEKKTKFDSQEHPFRGANMPSGKIEKGEGALTAMVSAPMEKNGVKVEPPYADQAKRKCASSNQEKAVMKWMHDVDEGLGSNGKLATLKKYQAEIANWKKSVLQYGAHAWLSGVEGNKVLGRMAVLQEHMASAEAWLKRHITIGKAALEDEMNAPDMVMDVALFAVRHHPALKATLVEYERRARDENSWFRQVRCIESPPVTLTLCCHD